MEKAKHFSQGKLRWDLLPLEVIEGDIRVMEYGFNKYGNYNWQKGTDYLEFWDSAMRHLTSWRNGEDVDKESGLPHLSHARVNEMFLYMYQLRKMSKFDNRLKNKI